jgi:antitoxin YefM
MNKIPKFKNEDAERAFWASHDSTGYIDWKKGRKEPILSDIPTLSASVARAQFCKLLEQTAASHKPVRIIGKRSNAVLVSEEKWRSIQETLRLLSIPGMRESIRRGLKSPVKKSIKKSSFWDRRIQQDVRAGKLDSLSKEALAAHKGGKSRALHVQRTRKSS